MKQKWKTLRTFVIAFVVMLGLLTVSSCVRHNLIDLKEFSGGEINVGWRYRLPFFHANVFCQITSGDGVIEEVRIRTFDTIKEAVKNMCLIEIQEDEIILRVENIGRYNTRQKDFDLVGKGHPFRRILIRPKNWL